MVTRRTLGAAERLTLQTYFANAEMRTAFAPLALIVQDDEPWRVGAPPTFALQVDGYARLEHFAGLAGVDQKTQTIISHRLIPTADPGFCAFIAQLRGTPWEAFALAFPAATYPTPLTVRDFLAELRTVATPARDWPDEGEVHDYAFAIVDLPADFTWYHATRAAVMRSIKQHGLLPSGSREQGQGWTEVNLHLQNAVYLTTNPDYGYAIAQTLANRFDETAVVLEIAGAALQDLTKLVPDEDAFRSREVIGEFDYGTVDRRFPIFFSSMNHRVESVGCLHRIPTRYLKLIERIGPEEA